MGDRKGCLLNTYYICHNSPNSLLLGVLNSFLRCVRPLCHCWCPPFSAGHVAFLFICLPGLSLLVSALFHWPCSISLHLQYVLFRWPCSISVHLSPRCVTAGVRPLPLAMQHFYSFPKQFAAFQFVCLYSDFFTFVSQVRCLHCWCPPFSAGHHSFVSHVVCLPLFSRLGACTAAIRPFPLSSISIHLSPR